MTKVLPRKVELILHAFAVVLRIRLNLTLRRTLQIRGRIASCGPFAEPDEADLREVAWSVRAAARLVPRATCLTKAFAAQDLLAQRGKGSTVQVTVPASGDFRPHAWLLARGIIALGGSAAMYAGHRRLIDYRAES